MTRNLHGLHALVLGLGESGLAMARWCARQGARVTVADTRAAPPNAAALASDVPQARLITGALSPSLTNGVDVVCASPGLTPSQVAPITIAVEATNTWATAEFGLFLAALNDLKAARDYTPEVLAVTGTNGKTTVTALTAALVAKGGKRVVAAGNIGPSLLDALMAALDADALPEVWVIELSSFQLHGSEGFEPTAATVLNLTQDHLDWHGDMAAYAEAKSRVFGDRGTMLLNRDDAAVMRMAPTAAGGKRGARKSAPRRVVTFGSDLPTKPGDFGLETVNGMTWLVRSQALDETRRRRSRRVAPVPAPVDGERGTTSVPAVPVPVADAAPENDEVYLQRLMPADALRIRGRHNALNALAALALATEAGLAIGPLLYGLREYAGEPHRAEPVARIGDVEWIDDSKGTNVGATVAALEGFGAEYPGRRLVVILGGDGKGQDFSPLAAPVGRHVHAAVLIGRDAELIRGAIDGLGVDLIDARSMDEAVSAAGHAARPGDAVLLSPACASLDMFESYIHRADAFRAAVAARVEETTA